MEEMRKNGGIVLPPERAALALHMCDNKCRKKASISTRGTAHTINLCKGVIMGRGWGGVNKK